MWGFGNLNSQPQNRAGGPPESLAGEAKLGRGGWVQAGPAEGPGVSPPPLAPSACVSTLRHPVPDGCRTPPLLAPRDTCSELGRGDGLGGVNSVTQQQQLVFHGAPTPPNHPTPGPQGHVLRPAGLWRGPTRAGGRRSGHRGPAFEPAPPGGRVARPLAGGQVRVRPRPALD